jgi:hypothetical protein
MRQNRSVATMTQIAAEVPTPDPPWSPSEIKALKAAPKIKLTKVAANILKLRAANTAADRAATEAIEAGQGRREVTQVRHAAFLAAMETPAEVPPSNS